jgi:hypothetical protein
MDIVFHTCRTVAWVSSHITSAASLKSDQSTPASHETSTQQILVRLLASQLMESLEVDLPRFFVVDWCH